MIAVDFFINIRIGSEFAANPVIVVYAEGSLKNKLRNPEVPAEYLHPFLPLTQAYIKQAMILLKRKRLRTESSIQSLNKK